MAPHFTAMPRPSDMRLGFIIKLAETWDLDQANQLACSSRNKRKIFHDAMEDKRVHVFVGITGLILPRYQKETEVSDEGKAGYLAHNAERLKSLELDNIEERASVEDKFFKLNIDFDAVMEKCIKNRYAFAAKDGITHGAVNPEELDMKAFIESTLIEISNDKSARPQDRKGALAELMKLSGLVVGAQKPEIKKPDDDDGIVNFIFEQPGGK